MYFWIILSAALLIAVIVLIVKVVLLRRGYDELVKDIEDQTEGRTHVPVALTTSDKHAVRAARKLDEELSRLHDERNRYEQGNRKISTTVTNISHDLRTPLTAINSYLDLLDEEEDEEVRKEYLRRIKSRTKALTDLTGELFEYSKSSAALSPEGTSDVPEEKIDINRELEECLLSFYAAFKNKGIEPEIELSDCPVMVFCDRKSADRIFENIIGNALKYAEQSFSIKLTKDAKVTFRNPAPELTPVQVSKFFDRYYTVNDAKESTGLGLSIARELATKNRAATDAQLCDGDLVVTVSFTGAS